MKKALTFDDVLLVPAYNPYPSRGDERITTGVKVKYYTFGIPIISANMDTITGVEMAEKMSELGGLGILHRFCSIEDNVQMLKDTKSNYVGVSVGVNEGMDRANALYEAGARIFCVDVAHGHSKSCGQMVKDLKATFDDVLIIAGNVCCLTPDTPILTRDLKWVPAGSLKVGDQIVGFEEFPKNGKKRTLQEAKITFSGLRKVKCYKITLSNGESYIATGEHQWLGWDGNKSNRVWLKTEKMFNHFKKGKFSLPRIIRPWQELESSEEKGYLAAAFDGEGCLRLPGKSRGMELTFTQKDNSMLKKVKECLDKFNFKYTEALKKNSDCYSLRIIGHGEVIRFLSQIRPVRLMDKWMNWNLENAAASMSSKESDKFSILSIEDVGEQEVATISSSSATYISNGFGSHNTYAGADYLASCGADMIKVGIGGGCFIPDSQVRTDKGLKSIQHIEIGDRVQTHTGQFQEVIALFNRPIFSEDGEDIIQVNDIHCTQNHEFYVVDKSKKDVVTEENIAQYAYWIPASELDKTKHLLVELE